MEISEIMSSNVVSIAPTQTAQEAARLMRTHGVGVLPVADGGKIKGVVTDRDIVIRCVAKDVDPAKTPAEDIMTESPVFISPDQDVHEAVRLMGEEQVRRLPVVENGVLCGIVSLGDLARKKADTEFAAAVAEISRPS